MTSGYSSYFTITSLALTSIQVSSSVSKISAYFDFTITALLKDQASSTWTASTTLTLTGSLSISGDTSSTTDSGSASFSIYSSQSGSLIITVSSSSVSGQTTITILKNSLKILSVLPTVTNTQPSYPHNSFTVIVQIYNSDLSVLNSKSIQFSVSLSLTNSGTLSGTTTKSSSLGEVSFDSLSITSTGTFKIQAQVTDMNQASSNDITILPYSLAEIQVVPSSPVSCNFDFTLSLKLYDQKAELWTSDTSLSLTTGTSLYGELSKTISLGQGEMVVWSATVGNNLITVQSGSVTATANVEVLSNSLRIDLINPVVMFM